MLRRRFLQNSLGLLGTSLLAQVPLTSFADDKTIYDCIIIGAGPAGLTAARQLANAKIKGKPLKVLVLEGSSRIGGRMYTDRSLTKDFGAPLELGAEYIHVAPGLAPIWNEVSRYNLSTKSYPKLLKGYLYNSEFLAPTPHSPLYSIGHLNFKILRSYKIFKDIQNYDGPDISGAKFIKLMGYNGFPAESAEALLTGHLGAPLNTVSMRGFQYDHIIPQIKGTHEFYVQGGYDQILRGMCNEITADKILLNHKVQKLRPGKDNTVVVQTSQGTFTARSVLSTVSLGMLKSHAIDFGPYWTTDKDTALQFLESAHQIKVSIRFSKQFWPDDMCMLNHLEKSERRTGHTYFVPNYKEGDKPPVLTALISGDPAKRLLPMSSKDIVREICKDLDVMFKLQSSSFKKIAQRQDKSLIYSCKKWTNDPFAKGGISYLQVHDSQGKISTQNARKTLAQETRPVFWAGEATSLVQQPASVHGAHSTGLRAFTEIFNYLQGMS